MISDRASDKPARGVVDFVLCGMLWLGAPSFAAISLILFLLGRGVSPQLIEKGMVWLSVPWFAFCYAMCKISHETTLYVADPNKDADSSRRTPSTKP